MKYKIGDKVKIRRDLLSDTMYGWYYYEWEMVESVRENNYVGRIIDVRHYGYKLDICPNRPYFTDEMIEGKVNIPEIDSKELIEFLIEEVQHV